MNNYPPQGPFSTCYAAQPSNTQEPKMSQPTEIKEFKMNKRDAMMAMLNGEKLVTRGSKKGYVFYHEVSGQFRTSENSLLPMDFIEADTPWEIYEEPKSLIDSAMELLYARALSPEDAEHLKAAYPNIVGASDEYMEQFRKILGIREEPVYEWQWKIGKKGIEGWDDFSAYMTDEEFLDFRGRRISTNPTKFEKDESTKRERVK